MYFCHEYRYDFPLMDYLCGTFGLDAELDCVLFMKDTEQTWGSSWLYRNRRIVTSGGPGSVLGPRGHNEVTGSEYGTHATLRGYVGRTSTTGGISFPWMPSRPSRRCSFRHFRFWTAK